MCASCQIRQDQRNTQRNSKVGFRYRSYHLKLTHPKRPKPPILWKQRDTTILKKKKSHAHFNVSTRARRVSVRHIKLHKQKKLSWYDTTDSVDCICKPAPPSEETAMSAVWVKRARPAKVTIINNSAKNWMHTIIARRVAIFLFWWFWHNFVKRVRSQSEIIRGKPIGWTITPPGINNSFNSYLDLWNETLLITSEKLCVSVLGVPEC